MLLFTLNLQASGPSQNYTILPNPSRLLTSNGGFAGDFSFVLEGETDIFSISFTPRIITGETIISSTARVECFSGSPVPDAAATDVLLAGPSISGSTVSCVCGGALPAGFQPGAIYSLWVTATTSYGRVLETFGNITCQSYT